MVTAVEERRLPRPALLADREIDARGHFSPGPLLELARAIHEATVGQKVAIVSDDRATIREIQEWLRRDHHQAFLGTTDVNGATRFVMRRTH